VAEVSGGADGGDGRDAVNDPPWPLSVSQYFRSAPKTRAGPKQSVSKTLPKVKVHGPTLDRVEGAVVADALSAERIEASVSANQGPIALFGLRQALAERRDGAGARAGAPKRGPNRAGCGERRWRV
jgi:hypothetical protein